MTDEDTAAASNVNPSGNLSDEINIKRLGGQQKDILRHFYKNDETVFQQVEVIEALYGDVTDARKASVSRSISKLRDYGLVYERKKVLITPDAHSLVNAPYYSRHRPRYQLTDDGQRFVESDERFPEIP